MTPYEITGGPAPEWKCSSCKWKPKPGVFLYSDPGGNFHCPECNDVLPGKRFL